MVTRQVLHIRASSAVREEAVQPAARTLRTLAGLFTREPNAFGGIGGQRTAVARAWRSDLACSRESLK